MDKKLSEVRMLMRATETEEVKVEIYQEKVKERKDFRDYLVIAICWVIDVVIKSITYVISSAILMVGGVIYFVIETIVKIIFFIVMFLITCWVVGALLKICWMIWGPKNG